MKRELRWYGLCATRVASAPGLRRRSSGTVLSVHLALAQQGEFGGLRSFRIGSVSVEQRPLQARAAVARAVRRESTESAETPPA